VASGSYQWFDGTSAAAPFVSGAVALLYSINPTLYSYQITDYYSLPLFLGADYLIGVAAAEQGHGRLNAYHSLQALFDLGITANDGQSAVYPGQMLTYVQSFDNHGLTNVGNATVTVMLPPGLQYVSSSPAFTDNGNGIYTMNTGALAVGATGTSQVTARVRTQPRGTALALTTRIDINTGELNMLDNTATDTDIVAGSRAYFPLLLR
jgi:uncharacterized repeat protein (TIGR01451 family)